MRDPRVALLSTRATGLQGTRSPGMFPVNSTRDFESRAEIFF
jgi:hypothetical protein